MSPERILELAGVTVGTGEGEFPMPTSGIEDTYEQAWDNTLCQVIGPLGWDDGEPYFLPVTAGLLQEWTETHKCDPPSVRVEMHLRDYVLEQIIRGTMREP